VGTDRESAVRTRDTRDRGQILTDFGQFCGALDIRAVIAEADASGQLDGHGKELYAIAILRALHNGDFGKDRQVISEAVSAFWEHGYENGFNVRSFNAVFEKFFNRW